MNVAASSTGKKDDLRDSARMVKLTAQTAEEAKWLAAVYCHFVLGTPIPQPPDGEDWDRTHHADQSPAKL